MLGYNKIKILGIFCHPDDEVLAGWPIFQRDDVEKHLIILCDDSTRNRPERKQALIRVCKQENINLYKTLSEDNNFYALPTRRADYVLLHAVERIKVYIGLAIDQIKPTYIFTHNPVGEYGHGSHRLCFELVSQHPLVEKLIFTDICEKSNHRSSSTIPTSVRMAYYGYRRQLLTEDIQKLDTAFYNRTKVVYDKYNAWTWDFPPITECNLFQMRM